MRDMTAGVVTEIAKGEVQPVIFAELEFDSGTTRYWTGYGSLSWDSKTWLGTGDLGTISEISETRSVRAEGITLEISGIPSANIALALTENYQGRPVSIWHGFVDDAVAVLADPVLTFKGLMDGMSIRDEGETSTIQVSAENRLAELKRSRERRSTDQDQRIDYPNDRAYEFVAGLQDKDIRWGP